ncbi:g3996 [Coccomyxa viridis]|uniref:G3996 protein n=1 Tax=Coccomyxa viridis TaxID=1274662 RepID=A0ABP1FP79_9CHLO
MGDAQLKQWFQAVDQDRSNAIDAGELQKALALGNLHFSLAVCAHIIRIHDKDNSGTIDFKEFRTLHQFLTDTQNKFFQADKERRGKLIKAEVSECLKKQGYTLDIPAFEAMFRAYNPERNGQMDLTCFIAMMIFLQSANATFAAFSQGGNRISLDYNQFLYATANVV